MQEYGFSQKEVQTLFFGKKMVTAVNLAGDAILGRYGLKSYHLALLRVIASEDGIEQKGIRKIIPFDKSRISVVVRELTEGGFIFDSGRGRSSSLHLTEKGLEAVRHTPEFRRRVDSEVFSVFTSAEKDEMDRLFTKLNDHLDEILVKYTGHQ